MGRLIGQKVRSLLMLAGVAFLFSCSNELNVRYRKVAEAADCDAVATDCNTPPATYKSSGSDPLNFQFYPYEFQTLSSVYLVLPEGAVIDDSILTLWHQGEPLEFEEIELASSPLVLANTNRIVAKPRNPAELRKILAPGVTSHEFVFKMGEADERTVVIAGVLKDFDMMDTVALRSGVMTSSSGETLQGWLSLFSAGGEAADGTLAVGFNAVINQ